MVYLPTAKKKPKTIVICVDLVKSSNFCWTVILTRLSSWLCIRGTRIFRLIRCTRSQPAAGNRVTPFLLPCAQGTSVPPGQARVSVPSEAAPHTWLKGAQARGTLWSACCFAFCFSPCTGVPIAATTALPSYQGCLG